MKRAERPRIFTAVLVVVSVLLTLARPALADDTPTFGADMARTRTISSQAQLYQGYALYSPTASYHSLGSGLQSYSTPTDYTTSGTNVVLAYAFEGQNGYLYGMQESNNAINGFWGGPVAFSNDNALDAAGVSGPTTANGYTAIGVGKYLYAWSSSDYFPGQADAASIPTAVEYEIRGNPDNSLYQVAMSPAITCSLMWTGYDDNLNPVPPWQAPAAVVGSWDGGVVIGPVEWPADLAFPPYKSYITTQTDPSSTTANITSSPTYIKGGFASIGTNGDGAVVFGVSGISDPWLVAMDPATGKVQTFGGGPEHKQVLAAGISSSPVWSGSHLYVADNAGNLYVFNPDGSVLKAAYVGGSVADDISNIALGANFVYAVEDGLTRLYVYDRAESGAPLAEVGSWAPGNGDKMYSPSLVYNPNYNYSNIYLGSNSGALYSMAYGTTPAIVTSNESGFFATDQYFFGVEFSGTPLQPYGTILADVGPDHLLAAWTNNAGRDNTGGIEYWAPGTYTAKAFFTQNVSTMIPVSEVLPNTSVTLVAQTNPVDTTTGVDFQDADNPPTWTPYAPYPDGQMVGGPNDQEGFPKYWYVNITAPSQPGTYKMTVTATNMAGQTAQATATLEVQDTIHHGSATMVNGQYLHVISYGLPGGFNNGHDPRPSPYLKGNLYHTGAVETKLADHIHCEEVIPASDILSKAPNPMPPAPGKPGAHLDGINWGEWQVSYDEYGNPRLYMLSGTAPTITYPQGSMGPAPDYETLINYPTSQLMEENGSGGSGDMKAQLSFKENWAGFFAHGKNYYITTNPWNGKKTEDLINPIMGYSVSSQVWVTAIYEYDPPGGGNGPPPKPEYFPEAVQYNSTVPLEITGTDDYIIPTTGGSELYEWY